MIDAPPVRQIGRHDPVVVTHSGRRLAIFGSHSEFLWAVRRRPNRFPPRAQVFRLRDGEQLSFIAPPGYCPAPSTNGMLGPMPSGGIVPAANEFLEN